MFRKDKNVCGIVNAHICREEDIFRQRRQPYWSGEQKSVTGLSLLNISCACSWDVALAELLTTHTQSCFLCDTKISSSVRVVVGSGNLLFSLREFSPSLETPLFSAVFSYKIHPSLPVLIRTNQRFVLNYLFLFEIWIFCCPSVTDLVVIMI